MAAVKGDVGKIMFENAGGTEADISGLRSWSLSITKDTQETTVLGNTSKSFVGGLISGEASKKIGFAGIVTSAEYGATLGEIQIINISFVTNGAITSAI